MYKGGTAGEKASLQCLRPSSELMHFNSSAFSKAFCPACPNRTLHMSASIQQYSSLQGEKRKTSAGEETVTTERTWMMSESLACWVFMGSQKSSYTGTGRAMWCASFHWILSLSWGWQGELPSQRASQQLGWWENLVRSHEIQAAQYYVVSSLIKSCWEARKWESDVLKWLQVLREAMLIFYMILDWQSWKGNCCNAKYDTYQVLSWCFASKQTRLVAWRWIHDQLHCPSTPLHLTWGCRLMRATENIWDFQ